MASELSTGAQPRDGYMERSIYSAQSSPKEPHQSSSSLYPTTAIVDSLGESSHGSRQSVVHEAKGPDVDEGEEGELEEVDLDAEGERSTGAQEVEVGEEYVYDQAEEYFWAPAAPPNTPWYPGEEHRANDDTDSSDEEDESEYYESDSIPGEDDDSEEDYITDSDVDDDDDDSSEDEYY